MTQTRFLKHNDGTTIAYHSTSGKSPGVVFLPGFKSDMTGTKAITAETLCQKRGNAFVRFDYQGHGQSSGDFNDGCIGDWAKDTHDVIEQLTSGPQVLIGSSMGGWIMLLATLMAPKRICGLLGIAAAPDFTEKLIWNAFSDQQKKDMETTGYVDIPNCYEGPDYRITKKLIDDGRNHLLLDNDIPITCPVRLIHGQLDEDVPWQTSLETSQKLISEDVEVTLVKSGDHRLSEADDLKRFENILTRLLDQLERSIEA